MSVALAAAVIVAFLAVLRRRCKLGHRWVRWSLGPVARHLPMVPASWRRCPRCGVTQARVDGVWQEMTYADTYDALATAGIFPGGREPVPDGTSVGAGEAGPA